MKENFDHKNINAGFHLFPKEMLFDVESDYYEQKNLAEDHPEICAKACRYLVDWLHEMMMTSRADSDPMWTVIREGVLTTRKAIFLNTVNDWKRPNAVKARKNCAHFIRKNSIKISKSGDSYG